MEGDLTSPCARRPQKRFPQLYEARPPATGKQAGGARNIVQRFAQNAVRIVLKTPSEITLQNDEGTGRRKKGGTFVARRSVFEAGYVGLLAPAASRWRMIPLGTFPVANAVMSTGPCADGRNTGSVLTPKAREIRTRRRSDRSSERRADSLT